MEANTLCRALDAVSHVTMSQVANDSTPVAAAASAATAGGTAASGTGVSGTGTGAETGVGARDVAGALVTVVSAQSDWYSDVKPGSLRGIAAGAVSVSGGGERSGRVWVAAECFSMPTRNTTGAGTGAGAGASAGAAGDSSNGASSGEARSTAGGAGAGALVEGAVLAATASPDGHDSGEYGHDSGEYTCVAADETGHSGCVCDAAAGSDGARSSAVASSPGAVLPASGGFAACTLDRDGVVGGGGTGMNADGTPSTRHLAPSRLLCVRPPPTVAQQQGLWTCFAAPSRADRAPDDQAPLCTDLSPPHASLTVVGGEAGWLRVIATASGAAVTTLQGHVSDVYVARFFPSGKVVLSGGADMSLRIWDAFSGRCAAVLRSHTSAVLCADFVDRGRNVVSGARDGSVKLWDVSKAAVLHTWHLPAAARCVTVITATGPLLAAVAAGGWRDAGATGARAAGEVGTDDKLLAVGDDSGTVHVFHMRSRVLLASVACDAPVAAVATSTVAAVATSTVATPTATGGGARKTETVAETLLWAGTDAGTVLGFNLRALCGGGAGGASGASSSGATGAAPVVPPSLLHSFGGYHGAGVTALFPAPAAPCVGADTDATAVWVATADGSCRRWQLHRGQPSNDTSTAVASGGHDSGAWWPVGDLSGPDCDPVTAAAVSFSTPCACTRAGAAAADAGGDAGVMTGGGGKALTSGLPHWFACGRRCRDAAPPTLTCGASASAMGSSSNTSMRTGPRAACTVDCVAVAVFATVCRNDRRLRWYKV